MGSLFLGGFLILLNVAIAWWNCYAAGKSWDVVKHHGSMFDRLLLWCAAIQSTVGFSIPILLGLAIGSTALLSSGEDPTLTPDEARIYMEGIASLWYLLIIFPILGSGLVIWIHSVREAIKRRDFASIATASWNTYANISNFVNAGSGIAEAFGKVGEFFVDAFEGAEGKGKLVLLAIMIVVVSILFGVVITAVLIKRYRRQGVQQFAHA